MKRAGTTHQSDVHLWSLTLPYWSTRPAASVRDERTRLAAGGWWRRRGGRARAVQPRPDPASTPDAATPDRLAAPGA